MEQEKVSPVRALAEVGKKKAGRLLDGRTWDEYPLSAGERAEGLGARGTE